MNETSIWRQCYIEKEGQDRDLGDVTWSKKGEVGTLSYSLSIGI